eukprot:TRINITY_DN2549_c0_g1_i18.p1 TRINITY_DN2549_c0_g1~~TRINITY_DN2549_c0_g1_i18.p1  ORF type:complete len:7257 (+),score=712.60 TRINITY_DN2549_c0_g1_i18:702-21773(+)
MLTSATQCTACSAGFYCARSGLSAPTGLCSDSFYCVGGAILSTPTDGVTGDLCPPGFYCPAGSSAPVPCPAGKINAKTGSSDVSECDPCPAGTYCEDRGLVAPTDLCTGGFYCLEGTVVPELLCPIGFQCPAGSALPVACPAGKYQDEVGQDTCKICTAGSYCSLEDKCDSGNFTQPRLCSEGYYCPPGTQYASQFPCPIGTFSNLTGAQSSADCSTCPPGYYCDAVALASPRGPCRASFYCTSGSNTATPVAANSSTFVGDICTIGHYCPEGSAYPIACPAGKFNAIKGAAAKSSCILCTAGMYCSTDGLAAPVGTCSPGFYCPPGTSLNRDWDKRCPAGFYCPLGSGAPLACPSGTYQAYEGRYTCQACPAGYYCSANASSVSQVTTPQPCPAGFYCPNGTRIATAFPCPVGTLGNGTRLTSVRQCTPCTPGMYCAIPGSVIPSGLCNASYYCSSGASTPTPTSFGGGLCTPGRYCPPGSSNPVLCPAGTFSTKTGLSTAFDCTLCTPGSTCSQLGLTAPNGNCSAGYYCLAGTTTPTLQCPYGYYCPVATSWPLTCSSGQFQDQIGQSSCKTCPAGNYCDLDDKCAFPTASNVTASGNCPSAAAIAFNTFTIPRACPAGYYCLTGTKYAMQYPCPAGTFSARTGLSLASNCTKCTPGMYCSDQGLTAPSGPCSPAYYCSASATTPTPIDGITGNYCPPGTYCPLGTSNPVGCPLGTFNPATASQNSSSCLQCTAGRYCPDFGLSSPAGTCPAGYYCPLGTIIPELICPVGHQCPTGSAVPADCVSGYYQDAPMQASCKVCDAGYYCDIDDKCGLSCSGFTAYTQPRDCPAGFYCLQGTRYATQYPCPVGTYTNSTRASSVSQCLACTPGMYCGTTGLSFPTGPCAASYYCVGSSSTARPNVTAIGGLCPAGSYCPAGSAQPLTCPEGTFNAKPGASALTDCQNCTAGYYCATRGQTTTTSQCFPGFYCPPGQSTPRPPQYQCPVGFYCPQGSPTWRDCPPGTYSDWYGHFKCKLCPAGSYCDKDSVWSTANYIQPRDCPAAFYCPNGTRFATQFPCPAGTFSNKSAIGSAAACQACTGGMYCDTTALLEPAGVCNAGYYCKSRASTPSPTDNVVGGKCPPGAYCPARSAAPTPCPAGTFSNRTSATAVSDCQACPAGEYCDNTGLTQPTGDCFAGFYCPMGTAFPTLKCPFGYYCPNGSSVPLNCPSGTFQDITGQSTCKACPEGYYCDLTEKCAYATTVDRLKPAVPQADVQCSNIDLNGTVVTSCVQTVCQRTNATVNATCTSFCPVNGSLTYLYETYTQPRPCVPGHYCPSGTKHATEYPCPVATYTNYTQAKSIVDCLPCTPGMYCAVPGLSTPSGLCNASYYCISGASTPTPAVNTTGGLCLPGAYCPMGTARPIPCPAGAFNPKSGSQQLADCIPCTAGYYCPTVGLTAPSYPCQAGYFCPEGEVVPKHLCPFGYYCTDGLAVPLSCPEGEFQDELGSASCKECPSGFYCSRDEKCQFAAYANTSLWAVCSDANCSNTSLAASYTGPMPCGILTTDFTQPRPCPQGYYCPPGTATKTDFPCPPGTFNPTLSLHVVEDCTDCLPGMYCATSGLAWPTGNCTAGFYCTGSSHTPTPSGGDFGDECPVGHYCPAGSALPIPCPPGTFNRKTGAVSIQQCSICTGGKYCDQFALDAPTATCGPGFYCPDGTAEGESHYCPIGYYCPGGTASPVDCQSGSYQDEEGQPGCKICPPSYYCDSKDDSLGINYTIPRPCPTGYYCPNATRFATQFPCPTSTFNNRTLLYQASDCASCSPGYYCNSPGMTLPRGPCASGYYCSGGASTPTPKDRITGAICPPGAYCPLGSFTPALCPMGTFSNASGLFEVEQCLPCTAGFYCSVLGLIQPYGQCVAGFYCPAATIFPTLRCPFGWQCPNGSATPINCPSGKFQDEEGQGSCKQCPAGYYCDLQDKCAFASFLAPGVVENQVELVGGNSTCVEYGNGAQVLASWTFHDPYATYPFTYCSFISTANFTTMTCVNLTTATVRALVKQPLVNATLYYTRCLVLTPGLNISGEATWFVDVLYNNYTQPKACPPGYYCPLGTQFATQYPCPPGTFSNSTLLTAASECTPCLPGMYCGTSALIEPTAACSQSYYCTRGASIAAPRDGVTGNICPPGTYCPVGSAYPSPCLAGTFNPKNGSFEIAQCLPCTAGMYCATDGLAQPTGLCFAGYYCPAGEIEPYRECAYGFYCPEGSGLPINCPSGSFQDMVRQSTCKVCPSGYYCDLDDHCPETWSACNRSTNGITYTQPRDCPVGYYCPNGTKFAHQFPCPAGTFSNITRRSAVSQCQLCTGGQYCATAGLYTPTGFCTQRYYCSAGASIPAPVDAKTGNLCPRGHYCPTGTAVPIACEPGTFNSILGAWNKTDCIACTPGSYCAAFNLSAPTGLCYGGFYCPGGNSEPEPPAFFCPFGMQCPIGSAEPLICMSGTYQDNVGQSSCKSCPAGYYCDLDDHCDFATNYTQPRDCPAGFYCPVGTKWATQFPCPAGTFSNLTRLTRSAECPLCTPGMYCESVALHEPTGPCAASYYCIGGSSTPNPTDGIRGSLCPRGRYCPEGARIPLLCPAGTFSNKIGAANISSCDPCTGGQYCSDTGLTAPNGPCTGGWYCPFGQIVPKPPLLECPFGYQCPQGSYAPVNCPSGYYQDLTNQASCKLCIAGYYCDIEDKCNAGNFTQPQICPPGHYCPAGTKFKEQYPCPPGRYSNYTKLASATDCLPCSPGQYCATPGLLAPTGPCNASYYCTSGYSVPMPANGLCTIGHYCPTGSSLPTPCPAGTFNIKLGSQAVSQCDSCTAGFYCGSDGLYAPTGCCASGYYCPGGNRLPNPNPCPVGFYCPACSAAPLNCPSGFYQDMEGQGQCKICPAGYYCSEDDLCATGNYTVPMPCPAGFFCPSGTKFAAEFPCPVGYYSDATMLSSDYECQPCPAGMYCGAQGLQTPTADCAAGYYCTGAAREANPTDGISGNICPKGHYCPKGSTFPQVCPLSAMYSGLGAKSLSDCLPCSAGHYCSELGMGNYTGDCVGGYYCPVGQNVSAPTLFGCPVGHYCPQASPHPYVCADGTYQNSTHQLSCKICPAGHYCVDGAVTPEICPARHYCPAGTAQPPVCPDGLYSNEVGLVDNLQCHPCPNGTFCQGGTVVGDCVCGYICWHSADRPDPDYADGDTRGGVCPLGHYCPSGAPQPVPCANGTLGYEPGLCQQSQCLPCKSGWYCEPWSVLPIPCPPGYYCPEAEGRIACPPGTYQPYLHMTNRTACLPCVERYACKDWAMPNYDQYLCPEGHYCPTGTAQPYPCPGGTYRDQMNASSVDECFPCQCGAYCPAGANLPVACPEGAFCEAHAKNTSICPGGQYCPLGSCTPVDCPPGSYCPPASPFPFECTNGTYCPGLTTVPLLCPMGWASRNDTSLRDTLEASCYPCPSGQYGNHEFRLYCQVCAAGYVCMEASTDARPENITTQRGYPCPMGYYCPSGVTREIACPVGTYGDTMRESNVDDGCKQCAPNSFTHLGGQTKCFPCGPSAWSGWGEDTCHCNGSHRAFQQSDKSCICEPGYHFYAENRQLSEEDSLLDCQPKIYERCGTSKVRSSDGQCIESSDQDLCKACPNGQGRLNPLNGLCLCDSVQNENEVCDADCRAAEMKMCMNPLDGQLEMRDGTTGTLIDSIDNSRITTGKVSCKNTDSCCNVRMVTMTEAGATGRYDVQPREVTSLLKSSSSSSSKRNMRTQSTETIKGIANPLICLGNGEALLWDVSASRNHYPVYIKDSLLNTNPNFDYGPFRALADLMKSNLTISTFMFAFDEAGVYVFGDAADLTKKTTIRVVESYETCPTSAPILPVTSSNMVQLGVARNDNFLLAPDWVLIGVLLMGIFVLVGGVLGGLWHFRKQTWGTLGADVPRYRNLGMEGLAVGQFSAFSSRGSATHRQKLKYGAVNDTAPDGDDIAEFSPEDGEVQPVPAEQPGTPGRNARNPLRPPSRTSDDMLAVAGPIPSAASEMEETGPGGYQLDLEAMEDDFWDYERQIDLEGFNVRTLYDKLEDQTIHVVSQLANQRDETLLLYNKILGETEALKEMLLKVNITLEDTPGAGLSSSVPRSQSVSGPASVEQSAGTRAGGRAMASADAVHTTAVSARAAARPTHPEHVHYELPPDLKDVLTQFLRDAFRDMSKPALQEKKSKLQRKSGAKVKTEGSSDSEGMGDGASPSRPADTANEGRRRDNGKREENRRGGRGTSSRAGELSDQAEDLEEEVAPSRHSRAKTEYESEVGAVRRSNSNGTSRQGADRKSGKDTRRARPTQLEMQESDDDQASPAPLPPRQRDSENKGRRGRGREALSEEDAEPQQYHSRAAKHGTSETTVSASLSARSSKRGDRSDEARITASRVQGQGRAGRLLDREDEATVTTHRKPQATDEGSTHSGKTRRQQAVNSSRPAPSQDRTAGRLSESPSDDEIELVKDAVGLLPGDVGYTPTPADSSLLDKFGKKPGQRGYVPPVKVIRAAIKQQAVPEIEELMPEHAAKSMRSQGVAKTARKGQKGTAAVAEEIEEVEAMTYASTYKDATGKQPGQIGFVPPSWIDSSGNLLPGKPQSGLGSGGYDLDYRDVTGRRVRQAGFSPPQARGVDGKPFGRQPAVLGEDEYDENYHDPFGRTAGQAGFLPPSWLDPTGSLLPGRDPAGLPAGGYDEDFRDINGKHAGQRGFLPPHATNRGLGSAAPEASLSEDENAYDDSYRDAQGRQVGQAGFIPPSWLDGKSPNGLGEGQYDSEYRDINNRRVGQRGFLPPPCGGVARAQSQMIPSPLPLLEDEYDANFIDANGRAAGHAGFIPPAWIDPKTKLVRADLPDGLPERGYDKNYRDVSGRKVGHRGFLPPQATEPLGESEYDDNYHDENGKRPGQAGFIPPFQLAAKPIVLSEGQYDEFYRDKNGRHAGMPGFIPPRTKLGAGGAPSELDGGVDENYVDQNGLTTKDAGFNGLAYDQEYTDANGKRPGQRGFVPPKRGRAGAGSVQASAAARPLDEDEYDSMYRDRNGLQPGEIGFITPAGDRPAAGYDSKYVDANGHHAAEPGFVPPSYDDSYTDASGKHPGQRGFVPPATGRKTVAALGHAPEPLGEGEYDENYRDNEGRKPGDRGFVPPPKNGTRQQPLDEGFDDHYLDPAGKRLGQAGFVPPLPTGGRQAIARSLTQDERDARTTKRKEDVAHELDAEKNERRKLKAAQMEHFADTAAKKAAAQAAEASERNIEAAVERALALFEQRSRSQRDQADDPKIKPSREQSKTKTGSKAASTSRRVGELSESPVSDTETGPARKTDHHEDNATRGRRHRDKPKDDTIRRAAQLSDGDLDQMDKNGRLPGEKGYLGPEKVEDFIPPPPPQRTRKQGRTGAYDERDAGKDSSKRRAQEVKTGRAAAGRVAGAGELAESEEETVMKPTSDRSTSDRRSKHDSDVDMDEHGRLPGERGYKGPRSGRTLGTYASHPHPLEEDSIGTDDTGRRPGEAGYNAQSRRNRPRAISAQPGGLEDSAVPFSGIAGKLSPEAQRRAIEAILDDYFATLHEPDENGKLPGEPGYKGPRRYAQKPSTEVDRAERARKAGEISEENRNGKEQPEQGERERGRGRRSNHETKAGKSGSSRSRAIGELEESADEQPTEKARIAGKLGDSDVDQSATRRRGRGKQQTELEADGQGEERTEGGRRRGKQQAEAEADAQGEERSESGRRRGRNTDAPRGARRGHDASAGVSQPSDEEGQTTVKHRRARGAAESEGSDAEKRGFDEQPKDEKEALKAKHRKQTKALKARQHKEKTDFVMELEQEEEEEIRKLVEAVSNERAQRLEAIDPDLEPARIKALEKEIDRELQQSRQQQEEIIHRRLAEKRQRGQKILEEKHKEELRLEKKMQEQDEADLKRLLELAPTADNIVQNLSGREKRQQDRQRRENQLLEEEMKKTEEMERDLLGRAVEMEIKRRKEKETSELQRRLQQATSEEERQTIMTSFQQEQVEIEQALLAQREAQEAELQSQLARKRLEKEAKLRAKQHEEQARALEEQAAEIAKFDQLMLDSKRAREKTDAELGIQLRSQRAATEQRIADRKVRRRQQQEAAKQRLEEELQREKESEQARLEAEARAKEQEVKVQVEKLESSLQRLLDETESQQGTPLSPEQRTELIQRHRREQKRIKEGLEETLRKEQEQTMLRVEDRHRKKRDNLQRNAQQALINDLEKDEAELAKLQESVGATVSELTEVLPKVELSEQEIHRKEAEIEEEFRARARALEQKQLEEEAALEQELAEEQAKELARLAQQQEEKLRQLQDPAVENIPGVDQNTILAIHKAEVETLQRELETQRREQEEQLQKQLERRKQRKHKEMLKAHEEQKVELTQQQKAATNEAIAQVQKEAEQKAIAEAVEQGAIAKPKLEEAAEAIMHERQRKEQQQLISEQQVERDSRLTKAAETLKSLLEEAQLAIQDELEMKTRWIARQTGLPRVDIERLQVELKTWHANQLKILKECYDLTETKVKADLLQDLDVKHAEQRMQQRIKHLDEVATACNALSPAEGLLRQEGIVAHQQALKHEEELSAFKKRLRKQQEENMKKLEQEKQLYEAQLQNQQQQMVQAWEQERQRQMQDFEKKLEQDKARKAKEDEAMLAKEAKRREAEMQRQITELNLDDDGKTKLFEQHKQNMDRLQSQMNQERDRQSEEVRARMAQKHQKLAQQRQRRQEAALKQHASEEIPAAGPRPAEDDEGDHVTPRPMQEVTEATKKTFQKLATPAARQTGTSSEQAEKALPLAIPVSTATAPVLANVDPNALVDVVMRSPLWTKLLHIEQLLMDHIRSGTVHYNPYHDRREPEIAMTNHGLEVIPEEELDTPQFVAHQFAIFAQKAVQDTDPQLPRVLLRVARSLPAQVNSANAFCHSYMFDQGSKTLYLHEARSNSVGEYVMLLLHSLAHITAGDIGPSSNDANPEFLHAFYKLILTVCEELFFVSTPHFGRPDHAHATLNTEARSQLEQALSGLGLAEKEAHVQQFFRRPM